MGKRRSRLDKRLAQQAETREKNRRRKSKERTRKAAEAQQREPATAAS
jgi:hypothetical protein